MQRIPYEVNPYAIQQYAENLVHAIICQKSSVLADAIVSCKHHYAKFPSKWPKWGINRPPEVFP